MKAFLLPFLIISQALCNSIYDLKATDIHGLEVNFNSFRAEHLFTLHSHFIKFIYSEKATKFCEMFP